MKRPRVAMQWLGGSLGVALALLLGGGPRAHAQSVPRVHLLIATGVSGEPRFAPEFASAAATLRDAATLRMGVPDSLVIWLAEDPTRDRRISGRSTAAEIAAAIQRIARRAGTDDRVLIVFIGHGSSRDGTSRFNTPGPDLTDADFARALAALGDRPVGIVIATSASGDFVKALSGKNRVILTATKSGMEANESVFFKHFAKAYTAEGADADKDGRVSLLEAFQFTRREVQREYEQAGKLLTEHAVLDDDGDGVARADAGDKGPDGGRAKVFFIAGSRGVSATTMNDPRAAPLVAERATLESQIDALRGRKASMPEGEYQTALEELLLKLARVNRALRDLEGRKP